jgi:hypothetical protein
MVPSITHARVTPLKYMKEPQAKSAKSILPWLMTGALLLAVGCAMAEPIESSSALAVKVVGLKGEARCKTGSAAWQGLKVGDYVTPGAIIETARKSRIDLLLGADSLSHHPDAHQDIVRVWENSRLRIDKLTLSGKGAESVTETQLDLQAGHILGKARRLSAASSCIVRIPNAVASIHGATYDICAEGNVEARGGSVVLDYTDSHGQRQKQVITGSRAIASRTATRS